MSSMKDRCTKIAKNMKQRGRQVWQRMRPSFLKRKSKRYSFSTVNPEFYSDENVFCSEEVSYTTSIHSSLSDDLGNEEKLGARERKEKDHVTGVHLQHQRDKFLKPCFDDKEISRNWDENKDVERKSFRGTESKQRSRDSASIKDKKGTRMYETQENLAIELKANNEKQNVESVTIEKVADNVHIKELEKYDQEQVIFANNMKEDSNDEQQPELEEEQRGVFRNAPQEDEKDKPELVGVQTKQLERNDQEQVIFMNNMEEVRKEKSAESKEQRQIVPNQQTKTVEKEQLETRNDENQVTNKEQREVPTSLQQLVVQDKQEEASRDKQIHFIGQKEDSDEEPEAEDERRRVFGNAIQEDERDTPKFVTVSEQEGGISRKTRRKVLNFRNCQKEVTSTVRFSEFINSDSVTDEERLRIFLIYFILMLYFKIMEAIL